MAPGLTGGAGIADPDTTGGGNKRSSRPANEREEWRTEPKNRAGSSHGRMSEEGRRGGRCIQRWWWHTIDHPALPYIAARPDKGTRGIVRLSDAQKIPGATTPKLCFDLGPAPSAPLLSVSPRGVLHQHNCSTAYSTRMSTDSMKGCAGN